MPNIITVDQQKFLQVCKCLHKTLPECAASSLSGIQEALSGAFGFRNLNAIQSYFGKSEKSCIPDGVAIPECSRTLILSDYSKEELYSLLGSMLGRGAGDSGAWIEKSRGLLRVIVDITDDERKSKPVKMSRLIELLQLNELVDIYLKSDNISAQTGRGVRKHCQTTRQRTQCFF